MKKLISLALGFALSIFMMSCSHQPGSQNQNTSVSDDSVTTAASSAIPAPPQQTSEVKIGFPKGGEKFVQGKTYTLKWTGGDSVITIFLIDSSLQSQGVSVSISDRKYGIENTGTYEYTFPDRLEAGTYKFEIGTASSAYFKVGMKIR